MVSASGKPWWQSKTIIFNVIFGVLAVATVLLNHYGFDEFVPSEEVVEIVGLVVAIVNVILRAVTREPIVKAAKKF